jgi:tetratricopeptide (TPR) repeat protein
VDVPQSASLASSDSVSASISEARSVFAEGDYHRALYLYNEILGRDPTHKAALLGAAKCADLLHDHALARTFLEAAHAAYPDDLTVAVRLGRQLRILGHPEEAILNLREIVREHPSIEAAAKELARALIAQAQLETSTNPERALTLYRESVDLWPSTKAVDLRLGTLMSRLGLTADAVAHFRGSLTRHGESPDLLSALALALQSAGSLAEAADTWEKVLTSLPCDRQALVKCSSCYDALGEADRELELLRTAAQHHPDDAPVLARLGKRLRRSHLLEEAEDTLGHALALDPGSVPARVELARTLRESGRLVDALSEWDRVLAIAPDNPTALSGYASCAELLGTGLEALSRFKELAASRPGSALLRVHVGRQQRLNGLLADAEDTLLEAVASDPSLPIATHELARVFHANGDLEQSVRWWGRAIDLDPNASGPRVAAAQLLALLGRDEEALDVLAEAPLRPPTVDRHVRVLVQMGRFDDARQVITSAADAGAVSTALRDALLAMIAAARWELRAAESLLMRACADEPTATYLQQLAQVRIAGCDPAGAMIALRDRLACLVAQGRVPKSDRQVRASQGLLADIANEMLLDQQSLEESRQALREDSIEGSVATVRRHPGSQAASSALLIVLRRARRLATSQPGPDRIPRTIVQAWFGGSPPPDCTALLESWKSLNPGFHHLLFDDSAALAYLDDVGGDQATRAFRRARHPAAKADIFRLAYLAFDGGVWADIDDRCVNPVEPVILGRRLVVWQEQRGNLGNNFVAAAPGHPVLLDALEESYRNALDGYTETTWLATGPGLLSRAFTRWIAQDLGAADLGTNTIVLEGHELRRYVSPGQPLRYKVSTLSWQHAEALRG